MSSDRLVQLRVSSIDGRGMWELKGEHQKLSTPCKLPNHACENRATSAYWPCVTVDLGEESTVGWEQGLFAKEQLLGVLLAEARTVRRPIWDCSAMEAC